MFKLFKWMFWAFVIVTVLSVLIGGSVGGWLAHEVVDGTGHFGDWQVVINDEVIRTHLDPAETVMAVGVGGLVVGVVVAVLLCVVLPLVLLLGVGLPILATLFGLAVVGAALVGGSAVVFSPLLLPVLLVLLLVRRPTRPAQPSARPAASAPTVRA